ncbi:MAG: ADP-ribosyl-[dinitrogen reductase] hydrolase [Opitutaceae bacterium]|nr:ADP-ribosyl-[dinitrogen reductase] hydrolase [Opitutaceae bacterium]
MDLNKVRDRALGAYVGLAIGDALGATVEFMTASEIAATHGIHRELTGGGWLHLPPGQVTDDTQMALALGRALLSHPPPWSATRIADEFINWMHSHPPDIGQTVRRGLRRYLLTGAVEAPPSEADGGNGAAMRHLPCVLATLGEPDLLEITCLKQAHITHNHPFSDSGMLLLATLTRRGILDGDSATALHLAHEFVGTHPEFRFRPWPRRTTGYIVDTVQTVLDAVFNTDNFEDCVVTAVNRGGDADTIGALAGQLAGALYGASAIPLRWLRKLDPLVLRSVEQQARSLLALPSARM